MQIIGSVDERDPEQSGYVRAYLLLRIAIGVIGLLLPFTVMLAVDVLEGTNPFVRGSVSAYYYTGARDLFVGSLAVIGVFLIFYKFPMPETPNRHRSERRRGTVAGVGALLVAYFPTGRPGCDGDPDCVLVPRTPLQQTLGEGFVEAVHYLGAGVFIVALGIMAFAFGEAEGPGTSRPLDKRKRQKFTPEEWQRFHRTCGVLIFGSLAVLAVIKIAGLPDEYALFIVEAVCSVAFGASWLAKGYEPDAFRSP